MASTAPRLPEQFRTERDFEDFNVSELASSCAGAHSPFGDIEFPVAVETLHYVHPTSVERPNLADGR